MPTSLFLFTNADREALIEHVAAGLWQSRRVDDLDPPWQAAGDYWQTHFRALARTAVELIEDAPPIAEDQLCAPRG